jgi:hypothetical protein
MSSPLFLYFLLDQKVPKNQGLLKIAKNWRAILAGRNEVGPANFQSSAMMSRLHFFLFFRCQFS